MARAMIFDHQDDARAWAADQQYLLGEELIVAPSTQGGSAQVNVWLPKGLWFEYWTDRPVTGDRVVSVAPPVGQIALYVRSGAIVPQYPAAMSTALQDRARLRLDAYAGADGRFELYEDDGVTERYRTGESRTTAIAWSDASRTLRIAAATGSFSGAPNARKVEVVLHAAAMPSKVLLNGAELPRTAWDWSPSTRACDVDLGSLPVDAAAELRFE